MTAPELPELFRTILELDGTGAASDEAATRSAALLIDVNERSGGRAVASQIRDALAEISRSRDSVQVAVTGTAWIGGGIPSVERLLLELIGRANREIILSAYSITSGSGRVLDALQRALATGVRCELLVNRFDEQPQPIRDFLLRLIQEHPNHAALYDWPATSNSEGLHAKIVVIDRAVALVGSANLSARGLVTAHELAVVIRGRSAETIASVIDRLIGTPAVQRREPTASDGP